MSACRALHARVGVLELVASNASSGRMGDAGGELVSCAKSILHEALMFEGVAVMGRTGVNSPAVVISRLPWRIGDLTEVVGAAMRRECSSNTRGERARTREFMGGPGFPSERCALREGVRVTDGGVETRGGSAQGAPPSVLDLFGESVIERGGVLRLDGDDPEAEKRDEEIRGE